MSIVQQTEVHDRLEFVLVFPPRQKMNRTSYRPTSRYQKTSLSFASNEITCPKTSGRDKVSQNHEGHYTFIESVIEKLRCGRLYHGHL